MGLVVRLEGESATNAVTYLRREICPEIARHYNVVRDNHVISRGVLQNISCRSLDFVPNELAQTISAYINSYKRQ
jgi:hypothetical protein